MRNLQSNGNLQSTRNILNMGNLQSKGNLQSTQNLQSTRNILSMGNLQSTGSVSSTTACTDIAPITHNVLHVNPRLYQCLPASNTTEQNMTSKENSEPEQEFAVTQLKQMPAPTLQPMPVPLVSPPLSPVGSPDMKNKRKRYTPFRSPFSDKTNQDSDDDVWPSEHKRSKPYEPQDGLGDRNYIIILMN